MLDDSMFDEFKIEAGEMLDESEDLLLEIDKGEAFEPRYNGIFRAFHSLKGAAGMFGLEDLQKHMHSLESLFEKMKAVGNLSKAQVDYFLTGVDEAKNFLNGAAITFEALAEKEFLVLGDENIQLSDVESESVSEYSGEDDEYEYEYEYVEVDDEEVEAAPDNFSEYIAQSSQTLDAEIKARVIIIDDEEDIVDILSMMMEDSGYEVFSFTNGHHLLEEISEISPDIILSDISMPEMSGLELLDKVNEVMPHVPIIFISAFISKKIMLEGLSKGVFSYIEKPFQEQHVVPIVTQAILKHRTEKLLHKTLNHVLYQYSELDKLLKEQDKISVRDAMRSELKDLLKQRKLLLELNN